MTEGCLLLLLAAGILTLFWEEAIEIAQERTDTMIYDR